MPITIETYAELISILSSDLSWGLSPISTSDRPLPNQEIPSTERFKEGVIEIEEWLFDSTNSGTLVFPGFDQIFRDNGLEHRYLFTVLWETSSCGKHPIEEMVETIYDTIREYKIPETHWAILVNSENKEALADKEYPGLYFIEYFAFSTYRNSPAKDSYWNSKASKALFLTGKPHKVNRIGLLAEFYRRGLMDKLEWSLFMSDGMEKPCQLIAGFSDEEWSLFLKECRRDPDKVSNKIHWQCKADHGQASLHYSGFPYDPTLFSETKFSIISETWWWKETKFRVTEKTWKTIENNHPFIMASAPGALKYLRDRGFNTFENYLPIPDYNDPIQSFNRLEAVIENTEYLLKHDLDLEEEVTQNKKRYLEIVQEAHETIYEILRDRFKILPREREY